MKKNDLRNEVKNLATKLATEEVERTGKDYHDCISAALDKACDILGVSKKKFVTMFI
ncbi:hypothetical protein NBE98_09805 [Clostridium swellfunianum]|uniref:hypothetical protein n=1 Tax=Clostridium swellfunianum TaxID=1367462 RepID=UPI002030A49E|nr:hypothetical protein [Clostridium swellfunianum]MCM0648668.1 hypothetical protein [Clostridium swellfunianum]